MQVAALEEMQATVEQNTRRLYDTARANVAKLDAELFDLRHADSKPTWPSSTR